MIDELILIHHLFMFVLLNWSLTLYFIQIFLIFLMFFSCSRIWYKILITFTFYTQLLLAMMISHIYFFFLLSFPFLSFPFLSFSSFLFFPFSSTLVVLRGTGQIFCRMSFNWDFSDVFLMIRLVSWAFWGRTTWANYHFHHFISRVYAINTTYHSR